MNALLNQPRLRPNPQALALMVLAVNGTIALFHQQVMWWQIGSIGIILLLGVCHLFNRPFNILPISLEFFLVLLLTLALMLSTGGTSSFFLAWLFILALYYPLQLPSPLAPWTPLFIGVTYLALLPFSPPAVPLAIVLARSLLLATVGWSIYDLSHRLERANRQQKTSLESLEANRRFLRDLIETIPGITYTATKDGTYFMSPRIETLLGYPLQDFIDDKDFWFKCLHPDDLKAVLRETNRKYAPDETFACEYRMIAKDGRKVWFRDEAKVERDAHGYIQSLQGVMLEISQRKEDEAQLSYQASLVNNLFDAVISTDNAFKIVSMNKAAEQLYGYTEAEAVGKTVGELLKNDYSTTTREALIHDFARDGFWLGEATQVSKSGERFPILASVSKVFDKKGNAIGSVAINRDLREMKKAQLALQDSERRYRELLEQAAEGISVTDQHLQFILVNQALCDMLGYSEAELLQMKTTDLIQAESLEQQPLRTEAILGGASVRTERPVRRKDGSTILLEGNAKRLADGTIQTILHDITERKRAEEKLQQTEAFYRAITEKSNEGVMVLDKELVVLYRKPPQAQLYDNEELLGFNRTDLIHPDDLKQFLRGLAKLKSEQTLTFVFRIKNQMGNWDYFESVTTNLLDNSHINGYVVNYRNITERKRGEEKLEQTEAFYRALTEGSYEGVAVIDKEGRVRYRSKANVALSGYDDEQLLGQHYALLIHPDDKEQLVQAQEQLSPGQSYLREFRLQSAQGEWRWLEARLTNLLEHPVVKGYVVNVRDIHDRKQAEEKLQQAESFYRAVTEQSNEGVLVFDKDMLIKYRSPSKLHRASFPYDEMVGQDRTDIIHPEDLKGFMLELPRLPSGETLVNTFRTQNSQGSWDWFESRVTNLLAHPAVNGYVANYHNINERKNAEAVQRELSRQLLNVQEEERSSLARELHDEIGQSLTAIKVSLQTTRHLGTPEPVADALGITDQLISQVRELSLNLHPKLLEDLGLYAALRWYASEQAKRGGLEVRFDIRGAEVTLSSAVNITVYRIVQEALTNILRHAQAKCVLLSLLVQHDSLTLRIRDDGRGIHPALLAPLSKESIGLVSMRERAKLQGGRLELHSAPGQGTEVVATFPLRGD